MEALNLGKQICQIVEAGKSQEGERGELVELEMSATKRESACPHHSIQTHRETRLFSPVKSVSGSDVNALLLRMLQCL